MKKQGRRLLVLLCLCFFASTAAGCAEKKIDTGSFTEWSAFDQEGVNVGVADGYVFEEAAKRALPNATVTVFATRDEAFRALDFGDVDGVADDDAVIRTILRSTDRFAMTEGYLEPSDYGFIFPKSEQGEKLAEEFSEYIAKQRMNGHLRELDTKWFGDDTENKTSDDPSVLEPLNGTLTLAFGNDSIPFAYLSAGNPVGYEIDIAIGFCREYGYGLAAQKTDFNAMLSGVAEGNYDLGCGGITITEERQQSLTFSDPDYSGGISIAKQSGVQAAEEGKPSAFSKLSRHFQNAFLDGDRWKTFLKGILTTIVIFFLAMLLGSPFGVILFVLSERGGPIIRWITKAVDFILMGIPVVMILFSLYFSYYENLLFGGVIASVIGFSLYFGDEVYRMLRNEAELIDNRELLRNYHLLQIDGKTFFRRLRKKSGHLLRRDFRERLVTLLKFTSVTGYIGVMDMTKVFDTIRMESYEIVLPLIVTTAVYFILIHLICFLLRDRFVSTKS